jgi:methylated-DNA-[protein]-cysteine S-methyltransferase
MNTNDDLPRYLAQACEAAPEHLRTLQARLAAAAQAEGILDVAYRTVDSPVGSLLLAATEAGLVRVAYASENHDAVLQTLSDRISSRILNAPARLDAVARELNEYFDGQRHGFDVPLDCRASRAVGTACATNPLPVVVPCHRVVRSDGGMGGYLGGVEAKRTLLSLEAAA